MIASTLAVQHWLEYYLGAAQWKYKRRNEVDEEFHITQKKAKLTVAHLLRHLLQVYTVVDWGST